jgi:hypothetical protein
MGKFPHHPQQISGDASHLPEYHNKNTNVGAMVSSSLQLIKIWIFSERLSQMMKPGVFCMIHKENSNPPFGSHQEP